MAGFTRRLKPLKARVNLDEVVGVDLTGAANGDLLVYDSVDGSFDASHVFTGTSYTFNHSVTMADLAVTASATIGSNLSIGNNLFVTGDVAITDDLSADAALFNSLHVLGNSVFDGTVTITGTLSFAGFSISGNGTIAGSLTIGTTLSVTGAVTLSSTLVAGATTLSSLVVTGNELIAGSLSVLGSLTGSTIAADTISAASTMYVGTTLTVGNGLTLTDSTLTFYDDGSSYSTILNGTTTLLKLRTSGITECAGDPNGQVTANPGSLALRTDGGKDRTLYIKNTGTGSTGWDPVTDSRSDIEWLYFAVRSIIDALNSLPQPYQVDINFDG